MKKEPAPLRPRPWNMGTGPETRAIRLPRSDEPVVDQHAEHERRGLQELHQDATGEGSAQELSQDGDELPLAWLEEEAQRLRSRAAAHPHGGATMPHPPARPPTDIGRT